MILIVAIVIFLSCGNEIFADVDLKIVGGWIVDIEKYPYQASLTMPNGHCGGSIVDKHFILTAAHCFSESTVPEDVTVRVGSNHRTRGGKILEVSKIYRHPEYNLSSRLDHDIALIQLKKEIKYRKKIENIVLFPTKEIDHVFGTATGWGLTKSTDTELPDDLMAVDVPVVPESICQNAYKSLKITKYMLCAGINGKDTCGGDSGGPLVSQGVQIGVVSFGSGCGKPEHPGGYASVAAHKKFIMNILSQKSAKR